MGLLVGCCACCLLGGVVLDVFSTCFDFRFFIIDTTFERKHVLCILPSLHGENGMKVMQYTRRIV